MAVARRPVGRPAGPSQADEQRARLVREAGRLFALGGYAGLSFGPLAVATGVSKATVFHYFATKDRLVAAVFQQLGEDLAARAADWFDAPPTSFAARLDRVVGALVDFYGREPEHARLVCHGLLATAAQTPGVGDAGSPAFGSFVERFARFIDEGMQAGAFWPGRPLATIMSIGGVVLFDYMVPAAAQQAHGVTAGDIEARRAEIIQFVRRAVVRRGGSR